MKSAATTVSEYLAGLPDDRRKALQAVRKAIRAALPQGYKEVIQYGMISYVVPLKLYPDGYLNDKKTPVPFVSLASQKNHMAVYLMCVYGPGETAFRARYKQSGKKLDMGKSCLRFKRLDDLALDVITDAIAAIPVEKYLAQYEAGRAKRKKG